MADSIEPRTLPSINFHPVSNDSKTKHHLIYFLTGNPGLIGYYNTFLTTLNQLLSESFTGSSQLFHIHGQSLAGFEDANTSSRPFGLEEQIGISLASLHSLTIPAGQMEGKPFTSVILIGHSVGSYMLLEIIRRLKNHASPLNIRAGILLFPTVTHISKSPSGKKISTLFRIPDLPRRASIFAKGLVSLAPKRVLKWLVGLVTGMPTEAADVTTRFLKSKMGIWQALHMAKDEMDIITEDRWDQDIWGIEHEDVDQKFKVPKLIFYFGHNDHWVADHTRDALIAARGRNIAESNSSKPIMLIDEHGIDHGFCLRHSETIAEKVASWIKEMKGELE